MCGAKRRVRYCHSSAERARAALNLLLQPSSVLCLVAAGEKDKTKTTVNLQRCLRREEAFLDVSRSEKQKDTKIPTRTRLPQTISLCSWACFIDCYSGGKDSEFLPIQAAALSHLAILTFDVTFHGGGSREICRSGPIWRWN